jgi:RimJ/RimL family protein N-acetyltransferase
VEVERVETERLAGERMAPEHFEELRAIDSDPRVMATLGGLRPESQTRDYLRAGIEHWELEGFGIWVWHDRATGDLVGRGGLRRLEIEGLPEVEVAYTVVAERWGEGLATEIAHLSVRVAFEELVIPELVCFALTTNVASRRVMEKAGFVYERDIEHFALPHAFYRLRSPARPGPS